jgi:hypothetical protein
MNRDFTEQVDAWLREVVYGRNEVVFVAESWVEGGGLGLFAKNRIKEGSVVCQYVGDTKRTIEALRSEDKVRVLSRPLAC